MFKKNIEKVKNNIIKMLKNHYKDCEIKKEYLSLLNEGKFANATTFRYNDVKKLDLTIKDFSGSPYLIKKTLGKLFISIEGNTIKKLKNNPSVTKGVVFLSSYTLAFNFIKGKSLKKIKAHEIPKEFFLTLEKNIKNMHKKDIVHLDLRNLGNILMNENGYPYIIDFQSCISTKYLPQKLKKILFISDMTGVYKSWDKKCKEPLDKNRKEIFNNFQKIRKFWILKGYPFQRLIKYLKKYLSKKL